MHNAEKFIQLENLRWWLRRNKKAKYAAFSPYYNPHKEDLKENVTLHICLSEPIANIHIAMIKTNSNQAGKGNLIV